MKTKAFFNWSPVVFLSFLLTMCFAFSACSDSDSDDEIQQNPDDVITEKESPLLGTWMNSASDDMVYYIVFRKDGTGYFIKEGTKEVNFNTFEKKEFKWTGINIYDSKEANLVGKNGNLEINFTGGTTGTYSGTYQIGTDAIPKMGIDESSYFDRKTIFTKTEALNTKIAINGLWKGEYIDDSRSSYDRIFSSYLRINDDGSGYYNPYYKEYINQEDDEDPTDNYRNFSGGLTDFVAYEVTGDIVTLKDSVLNSVTGKKEVKNQAFLRFKKNAVGGYNYCTSGAVEQALTQVTTLPSEIGLTMDNKIWWDATDKNIEQNVLMLSDGKAVYLKKSNDNTLPFRTDNFTLEDSINGSYTMKDYNIDIDLSYIKNGKLYDVHSDILIERQGSKVFLGTYQTYAYSLYNSTNTRSSSLLGSWVLATEKTDLDPVKEIYEDIVVDNSLSSESSKLYHQMEFSGNNLLYLRKDLEDTDYSTCIAIVSNGKLFFYSKNQKNNNLNIHKQYEWELRDNMLWLKYRNYPYGYSYDSDNYVEHVVVYKKK